MPRKLIGGLIQCSNPINDTTTPLDKVKQAMFDKHVPLIEEAGKKGVQVLCLQEIFNGPYFCPSQDPRYYDMAEPVPGPTTEGIAKIASKHRMAVVIPVYESIVRRETQDAQLAKHTDPAAPVVVEVRRQGEALRLTFPFAAPTPGWPTSWPWP